jgi:ADP-ribose pyrophosphatase
MSTKSVKTVFRGRIIHLNIETVQLPSGHETELEIVYHPGGATIVALNDQLQVCVLRQYRHAAGGWLWELPAGKLEPDEAPLATAQRELIEEAGFSARNWMSLGRYVSSPGVFTEVVHLFLATDLQKAKIQHEPAESIEVHWLDFDVACRKAACGEIEDGKTVVGLLRLQALLTSEHASNEMNGPAKPGQGSRKRSTSADDTVPNLALEDTTRQLMRGVSGTGARRQLGVNPYDTFPNTSSTTGTHGTTELRRLSEWIRQKRLAENAALEAKQHESADKDKVKD